MPGLFCDVGKGGDWIFLDRQVTRDWNGQLPSNSTKHKYKKTSEFLSVVMHWSMIPDLLNTEGPRYQLFSPNSCHCCFFYQRKNRNAEGQKKNEGYCDEKGLNSKIFSSQRIDNQSTQNVVSSPPTSQDKSMMLVIYKSKFVISPSKRGWTFLSRYFVLPWGSQQQSDYGGMKRYKLTFVDQPIFRRNNFPRKWEYIPKIYEESRLQTQRYLTPKPQSISVWWQ